MIFPDISEIGGWTDREGQEWSTEYNWISQWRERIAHERFEK